MYWLSVNIGFFVITSTICADNCDKHGILIYEDIGCVPTYGNLSTCPVKYKCDQLGEPGSDKCYFKGKSYSHQEKLPDTRSRCDNDCTCLPNLYSENTTEIGCVEWVCDEIFGLNPSCKLTHSIDQCCATGQICKPFHDVTSCKIGQDKYYEGELFFAPNSCHDCVCSKNFSGIIEEPFCRRRVCGEQLSGRTDKVQNYCAPVYYKGSILCCPDHWICDDGSDIIKGSPRSDETCRFGNKKIKIGETFERNGGVTNRAQKIEKIQCECSIPPFLTCIMHIVG